MMTLPYLAPVHEFMCPRGWNPNLPGPQSLRHSGPTSRWNLVQGTPHSHSLLSSHTPPLGFWLNKFFATLDLSWCLRLEWLPPTPPRSSTWAASPVSLNVFLPFLMTPPQWVTPFPASLSCHPVCVSHFICHFVVNCCLLLTICFFVL